MAREAFEASSNFLTIYFVCYEAMNRQSHLALSLLLLVPPDVEGRLGDLHCAFANYRMVSSMRKCCDRTMRRADGADSNGSDQEAAGFSLSSRPRGFDYCR